MLRTIKKLVVSLLLTGAGGFFAVSAQSEEQIQLFEKEKIAFFTEKMELTDAESVQFWPLYNDYHNRKIKIVKDERNTMRYFDSNAANMSDEEVLRSLEKILKLQTEQHELRLEFHVKFMEILPPKKVLMFYRAERGFRMHLLRKLRNQGQGKHEGRRLGGRHSGGSKGSGPGVGPDSDN